MLDLSAPAPPKATARPPASEEEEDVDDELPTSRASWPVVLLASYASAVTIGLIWVLWQHRSVRESEEPEIPSAAVAKVDPGRRAANSRKITPPPSLAADRVTTLGKSVRIGALEVTPVEVTRGRVHLRRTLAGEEQRDGGDDALKLRLRLRNASKELVFAPLDEAFLREREAGVFDSFIEAGDGRVIDMYPLSVYSEWAIDGQEFKELKPGQTLDTQVISAADAGGRDEPEMTWRVRLRTGIEKTDVLGVRFRGPDVRPRR
jgi:hypothetical protein